jgi:hypothetical protein
MAGDDPDFETKAAAIIGLYLNPPQHAAVFCVDEKSAIQALDRLDPVLPLSPGRVERHGFEYYRHGKLSLYAALNVKTGLVHRKTAPSPCGREVERMTWRVPLGSFGELSYSDCRRSATCSASCRRQSMTGSSRAVSRRTARRVRPSHGATL